MSVNIKTIVKRTHFASFSPTPWPESTVCMGNLCCFGFVMFRWDSWLLFLLLLPGCCQNQVFCGVQQSGAVPWVGWGAAWRSGLAMTPDGCCPMGDKSPWYFWESVNPGEKLPMVLGLALAADSAVMWLRWGMAVPKENPVPWVEMVRVEVTGKTVKESRAWRYA